MMRCVRNLAGLLAVACFAAGAYGADDPLRVAEQEFATGNYAAAVTTLQGALTRKPQDARAIYWLGRCYYELRDYDNAASQLEQAVKFDSKNSEFHDWLGRAYGGKADRDRSFMEARKVRNEFEEAVHLDPANIQARRDLAEFYFQAPWIVGGSKNGAKEQIDAISALDPVRGHLVRAEFWQEEKKPDLVEGEYRWVLAANPRGIEPYLEVAGFYQHQGKAAEMKAAVDAAAKVGPNDPRLSYFRAVELILGGSSFPEAERYLKSYLASTPDRSDWPSHASARAWLGTLYEREGKRMEAAEQYRAALQLEPGMKDARQKLERLEKGSK
jgi:tetratricopeptide (TPR) repeat protein